MSQEESNGSRRDDVIAGEIVRADDEDSSESSEVPQTFLHKVASARPPDEEATAPYPTVHAAAEHDVAEHDVAEHDVAEHASGEDEPDEDEDETGTAAEDSASVSAETEADVDADAGVDTDAGVDAEEPESAPVPQARRPGDEGIPPDTDENLLADGAAIREEWMRVQARFVDDPRTAVTDAADLINDVAARIEAAVRERQQVLRGRWDGNGKADTEMLRVLMQQYRALLEGLAAL